MLSMKTKEPPKDRIKIGLPVVVQVIVMIPRQASIPIDLTEWPR